MTDAGDVCHLSFKKTNHVVDVSALEQMRKERDEARADLSQYKFLADETVDQLIRDRMYGIPNLKAELAAANAEIAKQEKLYQELYEITHEQMDEYAKEIKRLRDPQDKK